MDFIKKRYIFLTVSAIASIFSIFLFFFGNINYGIDMTWGTQSEFTYTHELDIWDLNQELLELSKTFNTSHKDVINGVSAYGVTGQKQIVIITGFNTTLDDKTLDTYKTAFNEEIQSYLKTKGEFTQTRYINIGKNFWDYIKNTAKLTLFLGLVSISLYIAWAFFGVAEGISSYSFAAIVLLTLLFDVLVASGLYFFIGIFFSEFQVDIFFITALLTILGYSINNTIVVFDRVRYNIKHMIKEHKKLDEIINVSLSETITRSVFTSATLLFVLITTFLFGPESMRGFILVLIFGTTIGTFSSLFLASSLLYEINKNATLKIYEKKALTDNDKVVV